MGSRRLKVLMATAEAAPFAKVGGLGDVMAALPPALYSGKVDIRLIMPLYGFIDRKRYRLRKVAGMDKITIPVGDFQYDINLFRSNIPKSKVQVFFVECPEMFDRNGVYSDNDTQTVYGDNPTRFILFSKAIVAFLKTGVFSPNILHLNDNQTALAAPMLRTVENGGKLDSLKIVLTLHNVEYQGQHDPHYLHEAGLDYDLFYPGGPFEFYGTFNFLKAGLVYSDKLTTVSRTYAEETMNDMNSGFGLEGMLSKRRDDYTGIPNGADYERWNPRTDKLIPVNYSLRSLEKKKDNKLALLEEAGLDTSAIERPLIGMVTRLVYQKGIDLLLSAIPEMMDRDISMVLLGTGEEKYHHALNEMSSRYKGRFCAILKFSENMAHLIEAGSDMFLMTPRHEPCGLNQLYSMKYGTIPLVRNTGGLADTVKDVNSDKGSGWGFTFNDFSKEALLHTLDRSLKVFHDKPVWQKTIRRAMSRDFSWDKSAKSYRMLYEKMLETE